MPGSAVIVEYLAGGGWPDRHRLVAKAAPDGHTLMVASDSAYVVVPMSTASCPTTRSSDFVPISGLGISPQALCVHPSVPANSLAELIALAKKQARRAQLRHLRRRHRGHLNIILLEKQTGAKFTPVHYRGAAPAITDLLGGHNQMMTVSHRAVAPEHRGRQAQGDRD